MGLSGNISFSGLMNGDIGETGGTTVVANPTGTATDTLNKIQVDETIYSVDGGGSSITITPSLESGTKVADYTIDETSGSLYAPTPTEYTAGTNVHISEENVISATDTTYTAGSNITIENNVISANVPTENPTAVLLWEGNFVGSGTIVIPNLSDWLIVGYCNYTGNDAFTYMSIGTPARGGSNYGQYASSSITNFAHRIGFNETTNTLTIDGNNRGIYFNGSTTYQSDSSCHIYSIYGLVKKPTT